MIEQADSQKKCAVCGEWTTMRAEISRTSAWWVLCPLHNNREMVEKLFGPVGTMMSSW